MTDHDHLAEAMRSADMSIGMYAGLYRIDSTKAKGFLSELVVLTNFGCIEEVDVFECANCGRRGLDAEFYQLVNVEPANYGMRDPYPGYNGDLVCAKGSCL